MATAKPKDAPAPAEEKMDPATGELVPVTGTTALVDAAADDYGADIGAGFENQTQEDVGIPFMVILQPGSPEVQGEEAVAKAGMIINKATSELISGREGLSFIPSITEHVLVEWVPRAKGGGLVATHAIDSDLARAVRREQPLGAYKHPTNENDLTETFYVYGVALTADGNPFPATVSFSSTHIKGYKDWMFKARSIVLTLGDGRKVTNLPLFSHCYRIRTMRNEKNGNTWYTPVVSFAGDDAAASRLGANSALYQAAKSVRDGVLAGTTKADTSGLNSAERADSADLRASASTSQEKAPY